MTQDASEAREGEGEAPSSVGVGELVRYVLQAARRHAFLGAALGVLVAALGVAFALVVPPTFEAKGKVLYNQNARITPVLSNPDRMMPRMDPLADVADIIKKKDNLVAIMRAVKLADHWDKARSPVLKLKDAIMASIRGPMSEADKEKALIEMLEDAMMVYTEGSNGLRIKVFWRDPVIASKIVDVTIERFLAAQLEEETAVITAAIQILENEANKAAKAIEPALQDVQRLSGEQVDEPKPEPEADGDDKADGKKKAPVAYKRVKKKVEPKGPDPVMVERLQKTREAIRSIRDPWQRRLADLKVQLTDLRGVYGPEHPAVIQQQRRISDASVEPPELASLLTEERNLMARIKADAEQSGGGETMLVAVGGGRTAVVDTDEISNVAVDSDRDSPELSAAKEKLRVITAKYNSVDKRLDTAQLELTTAQTAFKYRYVVTEEPEPPRHPISPNRPRLIAMSLAAALFLGLIAGSARELATGRFIEVWQVRMLGLPLLAEIKGLPGPKFPPA